MKRQYAGMIRKAGAMLLGASAALACVPNVQAQPSGTSPYVTDAHGSAIRNANYLCWHTGFWTPAAAIADCDPDLVARPPQPTAKRGSVTGGAGSDAKSEKSPATDPRQGAGRAKNRRADGDDAGTGR